MPDTSPALLDVRNLSVSFRTVTAEGKRATIPAVTNASFTINPGETLALVGESGSGKSVTALSLMKLLPYPSAFHPCGQVLWHGRDILRLSSRKLRAIRGEEIGMIFQEPLSALNPLHTIERQIKEAITLHHRVDRHSLLDRVHHLLRLVGLEELENRLSAFPHALSGGQRQRVMIAMALANKPDLLIADEPTTALDVTVQAQILEVLQKLKEELNMALLLITHDLTIVENMADRVAIMQEGTLVEQGDTRRIFTQPRDRYTKHLLGSAPKGGPVRATKTAPTLVETRNLSVRFPIKHGAFGRTRGFVTAADAISLRIKKGHTLGIVGESGSGKSTLALAILRLIQSSGVIKIDGQEIQDWKGKELRQLRQHMQPVFQDPFASLNPRLTIAQALQEGIRAHATHLEDPANHDIDQALVDVGLDPSVKHRYPHEFSGGQRQRICIARALVLRPELILLDEPTSALDLSTQSSILTLLKDLQKSYNLTYLFISHDLRVIRTIAHDTLVLKGGKIVEYGPTNTILSRPKHRYTKSLIKAATLK